jgi:hypothetical protein
MAQQRNNAGLVKASDIITDAPGLLSIVPVETKDADKLPKPAESEFENRQMNLFQSLLSNTEAERDQFRTPSSFGIVCPAIPSPERA